jgi:hypothetical protein
MTRVFLIGFVLLAAACGGGKSFPSVCANQVPPPAGCNTPCDPSPGAAGTCISGYHCNPDGKCDAFCTPGGGQCGDGYTCTADGQCMSGTQTCEGLQCQITDCGSKAMPATTISGTVFAPNGTLPLYGVSVYVPNSDPGPFQAGVQCGACADGLPGHPIVRTTTDDHGHFTLTDVPNGANIPVVITIGKWRREIKVANVPACQTQQLAAADTTLPKSHDDMTPNTTRVDMPLIAISTGNADSLECLVRRLGIADKEITTDAQGGRIQLFSDTSATAGQNGVGTSKFDAGFGGGTGAFNDSQTLWGTTATNPGKLNNYDIVILSCEGGQHPETKPQQALDHLKAYADIGGRVFLSHWHNIWVEGNTQAAKPPTEKPAVWAAQDATHPGIATFSDNGNPANGTVFDDVIDEDPTHNPKGPAFANWMLNVGGSTKRDVVSLIAGTGRDTVNAFDFKKGNVQAEQWVTWTDPATNMSLPQMFQFTTPNEAAEDSRCGKVVFSDMHVSGGPDLSNGKGYPSSCGNAPISAQEKALAFMFFDISSCVGGLQ